MTAKEETNMDEELAKRIEEEITQRLIGTKPVMGRPMINPKTDRVFIRTYVLENWFNTPCFPLSHSTPIMIDVSILFSQ